MASARQNPYMAGRGGIQEGCFFGRDDILQMVKTELTLPDQNAVVLFGQRRIGKTSILLHLQSYLAAAHFLPVYFDLIEHTRKPLGRVLFDLASKMAARVGKTAGSLDAFDNEGRFFRQRFLPMFYKALGPDRRPVLLFDEFDVLDATGEEQIPHNAAARVFFPYLRQLLDEEPRLGFVFVVGRKADELSIDVKALFKAASARRVSMLDEEAAYELITTAQREGSLIFEEGAIARILALTAGHPYFTQLVCRSLWNRLHATPSLETPRVESATVEAIISEVLEAGHNVFEWIWEGLPPAERVIFSAVASATDERSAVTKEELQHILHYHGIRILIGELDQAPNMLVEWEMLRKTAEGYGFFVELLRRWVASRKPLPRVKDEQNRIVPLAETLYKAGHGFYEQNDPGTAFIQLGYALNLNPHHLKARLLRGKILREQNRLEAAVRELEEACRYDEDASCYPLVQTLLLLGEELERAGNEEEALCTYERVLGYAPHENNAHQRRAAIWVRRGDAAMEEGDLEAARHAYEQAGNREKVVLVGVVERKRVLDAGHALAVSYEAQQEWERAIGVYEQLLVQHPEEEASLREAVARLRAKQQRFVVQTAALEAWHYEQQEQWEQAIRIYERLLRQAPGEQQWHEALERSRAEHELSQLYAQGLGAFQQKRWGEALAVFSEVVHTRADYKDAASLLARSVQAQRKQSGSSRGFFSRHFPLHTLRLFQIVSLILLIICILYLFDVLFASAPITLMVSGHTGEHLPG